MLFETTLSTKIEMLESKAPMKSSTLSQTMLFTQTKEILTVMGSTTAQALNTILSKETCASIMDKQVEAVLHCGTASKTP
jgi:hypothetical protein